MRGHRDNDSDDNRNDDPYSDPNYPSSNYSPDEHKFICYERRQYVSTLTPARSEGGLGRGAATCTTTLYITRTLSTYTVQHNWNFW